MPTNDKNRFRKTYSFFRNPPVYASGGGGGGGGGSSEQYWHSTTNDSIYTTGSVIIRGDETGLDSSYDVGSDVFFFVSGSIQATDPSENRVSVFGGDLVVSGAFLLESDYLEITGTLVVTEGISGSLTRLADGTSYLVAGSNITITTASNGQVTISAAGGSGSPAGSDDEIQFNNAGSFGASANFTYNGNTVHLTGSFSQGDNAIAYGSYSHAEGIGVAAIGAGSHAEGTSATESRGDYSHAEGEGTATDGYASHSEGTSTVTKGDYSHAEGSGTAAVGEASHTEGLGTIASGSYQHVSGKYNQRNNNFSLFVVGNGTGMADVNRSDVLRVNSGSLGNGRVEITGSIAATHGLSGSLTNLVDGTSYLVAGSNVTIVSSSNGQVIISSTASGGSSINFFDSTTAGSVYTTGSFAFRGQELIDSPSDIGTDVFFFVSGSTGNISNQKSLFGGDVVVSGSLFAEGDRLEMTGTILATLGFSGSLTKLTDGTSYLVAGTNITITSQSNGSVMISNTFQQVDDFFDSTTAGSIFSTGSVAFKGQESIDSPSDKGADVFFYVSGSAGSQGTSTMGTALFGGDLVVSGGILLTGDLLEVTGTIAATQGISGSLTRLTDGTSYLVAGSNITIVSQSNGSVRISSAGGGSSSLTLQFLAGTMTSTAPSSSMESMGMDYINTSSLPGSPTYTFSAILATTAGTTAYMDLYDYNGIFGGTPGPISGSVLTGSSQSYTYLTADVTTAMTSPSGNGIIEARIWCDPTGSNLNAICKSARLTIS